MTNLNRKILYKNKAGDYCPYDANDALLIAWCEEYNRKLRKGKTKKYNLGAPLRTNLLHYYTPYLFDADLDNWCKLKNRELLEQRMASSQRNCSE